MDDLSPSPYLPISFKMSGLGDAEALTSGYAVEPKTLIMFILKIG